MNTKPIKLIYIASNGRSGSTLLDLLLGAHPQIWTLGEFQILPLEMKHNRQPCGCGKDVNKCSFWETVIEKHRDILENGTINQFRQNDQGTGKVLRFKELLFIFCRRPSNNRKCMIETYANENARVLLDVRNQAAGTTGKSVEWLVDASKDPYRLFWLAQSELFDLRVVHIKKVVHAFACSMADQQRGVNRLRKIIRMTGRWIIENKLIEQICKRSIGSDHVLTLSYEDLAGNPAKTMAQVVQWLNLPIDNQMLDKFRSENHAISGNRMRYMDGPICLDEHWKTRTPVAYRWLIKLLT